MVRNAGKFGKPKRGGKKQFTQNLAESDRAGMWDGAVESEGSEEDGSEGSVEESEESESGEEEDESSVSQTRAERKAAKKEASGKSTKTAGNDDENSSDDNQDLGQGNSNRVVKKSVKINEISNLDTGTLNRKEREAAEKKAAQERYWKLHHPTRARTAAAFRKAEAEAKAKEAADRAALSGRKKK
ncbi:hypothetical protein KEM48_013841 [Puccinia striiformis f. sp. tritici PST-130]|nr:hypothetical protein KEM48_013841 [Puccinia striiformis f. sp. tritici PST-130]